MTYKTNPFNFPIYRKNPFDIPICTIRGKLGRIIALVGDGQIDDAIENSDRLGFADSHARDALTVTWRMANELRMALDDLEVFERSPSEIGYIFRAKSLIRYVIGQMGREGDEGEI